MNNTKYKVTYKDGIAQVEVFQDIPPIINCSFVDSFTTSKGAFISKEGGFTEQEKADIYSGKAEPNGDPEWFAKYHEMFNLGETSE